MSFEEPADQKPDREVPKVPVGEEEIKIEESSSPIDRRRFLRTSVMAAGAAFLGLSSQAEAKKEQDHKKHSKKEKSPDRHKRKEKGSEAVYDKGIKFLFKEAAERRTEILAIYYKKGKKEEWIYDLESGDETGVDSGYSRMEELARKESPEVIEVFHIHPHSKAQIDDQARKQIAPEKLPKPKSPPSFQDLVMAFGTKNLPGLEKIRVKFREVEENGIWQYDVDSNSAYLSEAHKLRQDIASLYPVLLKGHRFQTFLSENPDFKKLDPFHQLYSLIKIQQSAAQNFLNLEATRQVEEIHQRHIKFFKDPHTRSLHYIRQQIAHSLHNNENNDKIVEALLLAYKEIGAEATFTPRKRSKNETPQRRKNSRHH